MKKQIVLSLSLAVLAAPAFASKARLLALGEDVNGSFYINDNRNIFLNASEVNNHKDLATLEWGAAGDAGTNDDPNAEGGLYRSVGNMVYGVQFGRNLSYNSGVDTATTNTASDAIDVFVGGDAGIKWGAQATYSANNSDVDDSKTKVMDLAAGVNSGNLSGYVKYGVQGKGEKGAVELDRKNAMELGGSYNWENYTAFGQYSTSKFEEGTAETKNSFYQVGVGRNHKLSDKANMFAKLSYSSLTEDATTEDKTTNLPVSFGVEYDAASWLTLRGSVAQSLYSARDINNQDSTIAESTTVQGGASLKFGELAVDGVIGNGAPAANGSATEAGVLNTDSLMSYVSMTYKF